MNYNLQSLEQERRDAFDATINDLEKTKLQGNRQEASVEAAVNEGLSGGGRTAELIKRSTRADTERATASIKDNYQRKSNEIDLNKETTLLNTKQQIKSIKEVEAPSFLSNLLSVGTAYLGAAQTVENISVIRNTAGVSGGAQTGSIGTASLATYNFHNYYQDAPDFTAIFGKVDSNPTFTFTQTNPFVQQKQSINNL